MVGGDFGQQIGVQTSKLLFHLMKQGITGANPNTSLDAETVLGSVDATGRALLVQEAPRHVGFMAEVAARIAESETLYRLLAPVQRLCGLDTPIPYAPQLERAVVPQVDDIVAAAARLAEVK